MNEKEIKKYREEQDRKETEKMFKAINKNHKQAYEDWLLKEQIRKITKEKQAKREIMVNRILTVLVILSLLVLGIIMIVWLEKDNQEFMNTCTSKGYSENWCMKELGYE